MKDFRPFRYLPLIKIFPELLVHIQFTLIKLEKKRKKFEHSFVGAKFDEKMEIFIILAFTHFCFWGFSFIIKAFIFLYFKDLCN